ncbi:hypothetical protein WJX74_005157 [Apatococcus lobatus]|uniref:Secreted protein n=1 Tax=Apatococcus lobatus TaxID=904363 RepID=A0AAW1SDT8_9CHLO
MLLAATSTQIWVTAGSSLALVVGSLAITVAGSYLIRNVAQEAPETFNIEPEDRPRRRRINTLRKDQDTGSSGYRRVPPEPLEMQAKREEPHETE